MNTPENLKYSKSHEWVDFTSATAARIGLTDFAQDQLGGIVFVELPAEGDAVTAGVSMGTVESVKSVSDIICPVSGTVASVNTALEDNPEAINQDPYANWLVVVEGITAKEELVSAAEYDAYCEG